jgi:hypothetical protein
VQQWLKLAAAAADPILQLHIVLYIYVVKEAGMVYLAWGFEKDANQKHYIYCGGGLELGSRSTGDLYCLLLI